MPKDEYGVEYEEDVEQALKDPKGGLLAKVFDYLARRDIAKREKELREAEETKKKEKPKGLFDGLFGAHF